MSNDEIVLSLTNLTERLVDLENKSQERMCCAQEMVKKMSDVCLHQTNTFVSQIERMVVNRDELVKQNGELIASIREMGGRIDRLLTILEKSVSSGSISISQQ